ncbi:YHS domain-containing (seleno)protein [Cognatishimia activa]|uniref:YHS domain-containing (seleno)protein n=1 Tax=Cognatishimia activa TaxID=1715691 RepID=UPI002230A214|nr:YHS domain-containing (seleno)protein [Cognatishimia activa]UZD92066.1 YHS domain-containing protein [Cognatishimia activa]
MLTRRQTLALLTATPAALTMFPNMAIAQKPKVFQNPVAINAIDPIAYFEESKPVPGSADHTVVWNGAEWHFASRSNASKFESDPETYAPVFGGYCAFAASRGYLAPTIPEAWTIHEGKLYLNANLRAQELWRQDIPGNIAAGLKNWPGILG